MALEVVKEKGFNSAYEGGNENVQKKVTKLFNKIDENSPRYASLHGINNTKQYTEETKKFVYTQMKDWANNIIIPQGKYNKEDPNWRNLPIGNSGLTKFSTKEIYLFDKETTYIILKHELGHSVQKYRINKYLPNYVKDYILYKTLNFFTEGKTEKLLKGELEKKTSLYDVLS